MAKLTPDQRAYSNRTHLRNRLLRKAAAENPGKRLLSLRGPARKSFMDQLEREYTKPKIWRWCFDHQMGTQDRPAFKLYKAAVKLRANQLRALRQYDTARILDAHVSSLVDVAPREAWCYYPNEWQEISRALRPFNDKPPPGGSAAKLYAIYQRIRSQHTVEETP